MHWIPSKKRPEFSGECVIEKMKRKGNRGVGREKKKKRKKAKIVYSV